MPDASIHKTANRDEMGALQPGVLGQSARGMRLADKVTAELTQCTTKGAAEPWPMHGGPAKPGGTGQTGAEPGQAMWSDDAVRRGGCDERNPP